MRYIRISVSDASHFYSFPETTTNCHNLLETCPVIFRDRNSSGLFFFYDAKIKAIFPAYNLALKKKKRIGCRSSPLGTSLKDSQLYTRTWGQIHLIIDASSWYCEGGGATSFVIESRKLLGIGMGRVTYYITFTENDRGRSFLDRQGINGRLYTPTTVDFLYWLGWLGCFFGLIPVD